MKLYHATDKEYPIDFQAQKLSTPSTHYTESEHKDIIDYIDSFSHSLLKRKYAYFAFDNELNARRFKPNGIVYEVEMDYAYRGPMVLIQTLLKFSENENKMRLIAEEYYNPNLRADAWIDWIAYEYLGESFTVINILGNQRVPQDNFSADREKASRLFGDPIRGTTGILG